MRVVRRHGGFLHSRRHAFLVPVQKEGQQVERSKEEPEDGQDAVASWTKTWSRYQRVTHW
jgi:hypothetical protein